MPCAARRYSRQHSPAPRARGTMPGVDQPINQQESPYEAARRVNNVLRLGSVAEVRHAAPARCRVRSGDNLTDWLPWLSLRAGGAADGAAWWPPAVGEQVLLLAPGGDLAQAVVLPGVFSDQRPQGSSTPGACRLDFAADAHLEYLPGQHLQLRFGATVLTLRADALTADAGGGTIRLDGAGLRGEPDVTSGSVSLRQHKHIGVTPGPALTGPPA